jgi:DNA mismatch endonuclease (patch repair protein)
VLPGSRRTADVVFVSERVVVEVRGCYWHACPEHGTVPKANGEWWAAKLAANADRDEEGERLLREVGWEPVVVWEHEVKDDVEGAAARIAAVLAARKGSRR